VNFKNLSLEQILQKYEFPHRFLVYFASQCAKDAQQYNNKKPDPRSLKAIEIAERFGNGEEFTQEFLRETANAAAYAAYAAANAATYAAANAASYAAANAATYAANAAANAASHAAANAAYAANAASHAAAQDKYKQLLIDLIDSRLTQLEKLLILT